MGRERPSQAVPRKCKLRDTAAPEPGSEKGGRSRPPPISPIGTADPKNMAVTA